MILFENVKEVPPFQMTVGGATIPNRHFIIQYRVSFAKKVGSYIFEKS
jgi:hypothetical protein